MIIRIQTFPEMMLEFRFKMGEKEIELPIRWTGLDNFFAFEPPEVLYHYTDLTGANGIITGKSLRMTKIQYLNDDSELKYGINMFRDAVQNVSREMPDSERKDFLKTTAQHLDSFVNTNVCVASFCEDGNLLSQWRAYGGSRSGIALGFSRESLRKILSAGSMNLWKCVYDTKSQYEIIHNLIDHLLRSYDTILEYRNYCEDWGRLKQGLMTFFNTTFLRISPILKNGHFREEREWRIITTPVDCRNNCYSAYVSNERVLQYLTLGFLISEDGQFDILDEIVVGPCKDAYLVSDALSVLLLHNKYSYRSIRLSLIPYTGK